MKHWLINESFNFFITGYIIWRFGKKWYYPNMDKVIDGEFGKIHQKIGRSKIIWRHFWRNHGTRHVVDCTNELCAKL